jgi:hypothetical protein
MAKKRKQKKRKQQQKRGLRNRQKKAHFAMDKATQRGLLAKKHRNKTKRRFERVKDSIADDLQETHPGTVVFYVLAFLGIVAAITINIILIHSAVVFLVKLSGAPKTLQQFAAFILPVLTAIALLTVANQIRIAIENDDSDHKWRRIGDLLMLFTPLLLGAAFFLAGDFSRGKWMLFGAQVVIILGTELSIINSGAYLYQGFGFFLYQIQAMFLKFWTNHYDRIYRGQQVIATREFNRYAINLDDYNADYPETPVSGENFSLPTIEFVNKAMGREALQMPVIESVPQKRVQDDDDNDEPPTQEVEHPEEPPAAESATDLERQLEYTQNLLRKQARHADQEVQP